MKAQLTIETIHTAINSHFTLDSSLLVIVEAATAAGYIRRLSHTQAEWTEEGLAKARVELSSKPATAKLTKATEFKVYGSTGRVIAVFKVKALKGSSRVKADKVVEIKNIAGWGTGYENSFNASINLTQKTIRIYGFVEKVSRKKGILDDGSLGYIKENYQYDFDKTFQIGDTAEYDSYNLRYTAPISNITKSYVEFAPEGYSRKTRLKLDVFIGRNYDLDLEKISKQNYETSMYI